jgi:hypothetical protein
VCAVLRRPPHLPFPQLFLGLLALALAVVWIAHVVGGAVHERNHLHDRMTVTGSARMPITSNLVKWSVSVTGSDSTREAAARTMQRDLKTLESFLQHAGLPRADVAEGVAEGETDVTRVSKTVTRTTFHVTQGLDVTTTRVDVVERAATALAQLLEEGIDVSAQPLEYITTDLATAKLKALRAATADARRRAQILVEGLGDRLGPMRSASLGVYQITPRDSTDVSNYGINDTSTRDKDVTAVVSATFAVES